MNPRRKKNFRSAHPDSDMSLRRCRDRGDDGCHAAARGGKRPDGVLTLKGAMMFDCTGHVRSRVPKCRDERCGKVHLQNLFFSLLFF